MVHPLGELEVTHSASEMSSNRLLESSMFKILNVCSLRAFFPHFSSPSLFSIGLPKSSRKTYPFLTEVNKVLQCKASRCFHHTVTKLLHLL